jgi:predicted nucleotidyltransferase
MPDPVATVVDPFLREVDTAIGTGYTALLFGSTARGEHRAGQSDINLMLVLEDAAPAVLRALQGPFATWRRSAPVPPLVIARAEWLRAADAFPIEICDMRLAYRVLRGPDLLAELRPDPDALRRALERELRGKLLRLRQGYVAHANDPAALGALARDSIATILLLFRCLLALLGRPVPAAGAQVVTAAAGPIGFDAEALGRMLRLRDERKPRATPAEFEAYLDAVGRTARFVDHLQLGDRQ